MLDLVLLALALGEDVLALRFRGEERAEPHRDGAAQKLCDAGEQDDVRGDRGAVHSRDDRKGGHQAVVGAEDEVAHGPAARDVRRFGMCGAVVACAEEETGQSQGHVSATACHGSARVTTGRCARYSGGQC